ncbi:MAG TPA: efflux RND transporter periplasmic adaptor subunit [Planctomycetota bacterium]
MADEPRTAARDLSALRLDRTARRPRSRAGAVVAGLLLLAGAGWLGWAKLGGPRAPEVEAGFVRLVGAGDAGAILSASGYILPDRKADVSSKVFGRLEWLGVDVGSRVRKDEIVARLANADVAAQVEEAKAALRDAEREFKRWTQIVESGTEPRERLDRAGTQLDLARARLKQVEASFEYTLIRAPFEGVVVRRLAQVGETVGPPVGGQTAAGAICVLLDRASLEMVADVNESHIAKVSAGQPVEVTLDSHPDHKYKGEVRQVVPTADRQKGIVQVKVRLLDPDERLLPEMAARASFLRTGEAAGAPRKVIAPKGAVRERGGRPSVLVIEAGKVRATAVETGAEGEDGVEIKSGLSGGEQVVTGGAAVEDGAAVRVREKSK